MGKIQCIKCQSEQFILKHMTVNTNTGLGFSELHCAYCDSHGPIEYSPNISKEIVEQIVETQWCIDGGKITDKRQGFHAHR